MNVCETCEGDGVVPRKARHNSGSAYFIPVCCTDCDGTGQKKPSTITINGVEVPRPAYVDSKNTVLPHIAIVAFSIDSECERFCDALKEAMK